MNRRLLYIVRHGATEANLRQPYVLQGQRGGDLPLCDTGRRQAEAAAGLLGDRPIGRFFSSPLRRALQTARIIAAPHDQQVAIIDAITECDVGRWEGMSWPAIREQDRAAFDAFEADIANTPYAGGESFQQVQDRAVSAIEQAVREHPTGDLLIVTHNVVARVVLARLLGLPTRLARTIRMDNGGISLIAVDKEPYQVVTVNSVFHLTGLID
jgi:broad specificity phosphatase PhoE